MLSLMEMAVSPEEFERACETVKNGITTGDQTTYQYAVDTVLMLWEEQKKNEPKQGKMVFSKSMNPTPPQIREIELRSAWKESERRRRACANTMNLIYTPLTYDDYLRFNNIDEDGYLKKPIDRLEYYLRTSKYNNNVKAKG